MFKPLIIIPSRLGSTRLQEKALKIINGQPMIWHVWSNALKADLGPVVVATDSKKISNDYILSDFCKECMEFIYFLQ